MTSTVGIDLRVIESPSYTTIDNQKTGTYLITIKFLSNNAVRFATQLWQVFVDNRGYSISFSSSPETFDNPENIQIREHFIKSIKFLNSNQITSKDDNNKK